MDQGAKNIENSRYKKEIMASTRQGMDRNRKIEELGKQFALPEGGYDYEGFANAVAPFDPERALEIRSKAAPKGRKNPGQPFYLDAGVNEQGEPIEAPFVWSEEQGGYVPAGQYVAPTSGFLAPDGYGDISGGGATSPASPAMPPLGSDMLPTFERLAPAVMNVESRGNPNAVSPKGARGTMQTMPGTLADPGYGIQPARDQSPQEMERVGKDYLQAMLKQYADPRLALAAYNWGPGNVDKAMAAYGGNVDAVISSAPKETRDYIPAVLGQAKPKPRPSSTYTVPSPMQARIARQSAGQGNQQTPAPFGSRVKATSKTTVSDVERRVQMAKEYGATPEEIKRIIFGSAGGDAVPSGYRRTKTGDLEPIPGGPADKTGGNGMDDLNPRQKVAVQGVQRNLLSYASALTGLSQEKLSAMTPEEIETEVKTKGNRLVQGGVARYMGALPGGQLAVDASNADITSYAQGAGAAWAAYENPTGIITNSDRETATLQMPNPKDPPEVQAKKLRNFLELSGFNANTPPKAAPTAAPKIGPSRPKASLKQLSNEELLRQLAGGR